MAKTRLIYSETFEDEHGLALGDSVYADAADDGGDASLCPHCGDPLTWHEQACATASVPPAAAAAVAEPVVLFSRSGFAYDLGRVVHPAESAPGPVLWRGQLKERHPATGLVQRTNVYRLDNGFWDCYREEELQAA